MRGLPSLAKGAALRRKAENSQSGCPVGVRGFESHPPHYFAVNVFAGTAFSFHILGANFIIRRAFFRVEPC